MRTYPDWITRTRDLEPVGLRMLRQAGIPTPEEFYDEIRPLLEGTDNDGQEQDVHC